MGYGIRVEWKKSAIEQVLERSRDDANRQSCHVLGSLHTPPRSPCRVVEPSRAKRRKWTCGGDVETIPALACRRSGALVSSALPLALGRSDRVVQCGARSLPQHTSFLPSRLEWERVYRRVPHTSLTVSDDTHTVGSESVEGGSEGGMRRIVTTASRPTTPALPLGSL